MILSVVIVQVFEHFKNYILLTMLLQLSQYFSPLPTSTQHPQLSQAIPTPLFMSTGHVYMFFGYSISYAILYNTMAILQLPICTAESPHLFTQSPTFLFHLATIKMLSVSMILCSFCLLSLFLDSIVDRYIFIAIVLFLVLIFFFLNKSLESLFGGSCRGAQLLVYP